MFKHLLLPLTGSRLDELAIGHARAIAVKAGAEVHLMHVLELRRGPSGRPVDAVDWHGRRLEAEAYVKRVAASLETSGLTVDYSLPEGQTSEHIIHRAHQGADLLVLPTGAFGRSQMGVLGGPVLWRSFITTLLVRGEPVRARAVPATGPTTRQADRVVPAADAWEEAEDVAEEADADEGQIDVSATDDETPLYTTVLVTLDGSKRAECVLPAVRFIAEKFAAKIVLAHVVEEPALPRALPPTPEELELVQRLMAVNLDAAKAYLQDVKARVWPEAEVILVTGRGTASTLHGLVDETNADLLIMSAHGYGGDQAWPFGEVTTNVIGYGKTPLLLVHDVPFNERPAQPRDVTDEAWGR